MSLLRNSVLRAAPLLNVRDSGSRVPAGAHRPAARVFRLRQDRGFRAPPPRL